MRYRVREARSSVIGSIIRVGSGSSVRERERERVRSQASEEGKLKVHHYLIDCNLSHPLH